MSTPGAQIRLTSLMVLVAILALNCWLFQFGSLIGLFGLYVTKHIIVAWICKSSGQAHEPPKVPVIPKIVPPNSSLN